MEERLGKEAARAALDAIKHREPTRGALLTRLEQEREARRAGEPLPVLSYEELRTQIEAPGQAIGPTRKTMDQADDAMVRRLAEDLLAEANPERQVKYLRLFGWRAFPLEPDALLELARSANERVERAAVRALQSITHGAVRAQALEWLMGPERPADGARLLIRNYQAGDHKLLEAALARELSIDEFHWLGIGVRDCFEKNLSPDAIPSLLALYRKGYCGMCRSGVVEMLQSLGPLPGWMVEECRWDADWGVRRRVLED